MEAPFRPGRVRPVLLAGALLGLAASPAVGVAGLWEGLPRAFPTQGLGDAGLDVEAGQLLLAARGAALVPSGLFGTSTESAVLAFQAGAALPQTGLADEATWSALVPALGGGASGPAVVALQRQLAGKHPDLASGPWSPGAFDAATGAAVAAFQEHMGLAASGSVDVDTWRALVGHFERPDFSEPQWCTFWDQQDEDGTAALVAHLRSGAQAFLLSGRGPVAVGDISMPHAGPLENHTSHRVGLDVDLRLPRTDEGQCASGCTIDDPCYDREATRLLVADLVDAAHGHLLRVYSEDPALWGFRGVVRDAEGHRDHIHVRYCEAVHLNATYDGCWGASPGPF